MTKDEGANRYDDIIDLPHHVSPTRPRMPVEARAAQFAPFAALAGFTEAIESTAREAVSSCVFCEGRDAWEADLALEWQEC